MALKDIIGQEKALGILRGCIEKNRIPHALLFAGDEGIGKRLTAINFAKALNCQKAEGRRQKSEDRGQKTEQSLGFDFGTEDSLSSVLCPLDSEVIDSCGICPSCVKIDKGIHPDFFLIETEGDSDQIKIEAVRQLEEALSYKPYEGRYKIAIVDNADKMNSSAANAFLSTLESPPSQSIIILVSSKPDRLLPTIRSRCQRINFAPLPVEMMSGLVKDKYKKLDDAQALLLSVLSGGRLGYALNENLVAQRDRSFNIFNQMLSGTEDDVRDDKLSMEEWFDWAQLWLRDIAVFKATGQANLLINKDRAGEIQALAGKAALRDVLKLARELYNIRGQLNFNLNEKLTFNYTGLLMRKRLGKINAGKQ